MNSALADQFSQSLTAAPLAVPDIDVSAAFPDSDETDQEETSASDQPGRVLLFGRYMGQITARIERAWIRPRTEVDSPLFTCRVQIVQDHVGTVKEVTLQRCNGDLSWQLSLVHAIQTASPLPAPPDPSVYENRLVLEFRSATYSPGDNAEGFEPEHTTVAVR